MHLILFFLSKKQKDINFAYVEFELHYYLL